MRVIIEPSYDLLSQWAANYVAKKINEFDPKESKPFVLGLPTGSSPLGMYKALIELNKAGKVSFRNVVTFNMDEYVNLPEEHPESYHSFMWNNFFSHIDIRKENVNILNGNASDLIAECARYEQKIKELEKELGITVFRRTGKGVEPTREGAEFLINVNADAKDGASIDHCLCSKPQHRVGDFPDRSDDETSDGERHAAEEHADG